MNSNILLSVRLMTYNHSKHILTCLKGIELQQTSFAFEVIIGDDFSEDNNVKLIKKFISSSTNKNITYSLLDREKGDKYDIERQKKGRLYNFVNIIENCKGKYIALLDGDDYWIDPLKLQKQVDFLESNENFNICFTKSNQLVNNDKLELKRIPDISSDGIYFYNDLLNHYNFITTASVVLRKNFTYIPEWFYQLPYGDMGLYAFVCKDAKIKCLSDISSVYRVHNNGMWSGTNELKQLETELVFNQIIFKQLTEKQQLIIQKKQKSLISGLAYRKHKKNRGLRVLKRIILNFRYGI